METEGIQAAAKAQLTSVGKELHKVFLRFYLPLVLAYHICLVSLVGGAETNFGENIISKGSSTNVMAADNVAHDNVDDDLFALDDLQRLEKVRPNLRPTDAPPKYFYLVNPTSRKVLGPSGGNCTDLTAIEVQDRIYGGNSHRQQFTLTSDGRLKNRACDKVLSNRWDDTGVGSCTGGNEIVVQSSSDADAELQRWTFIRTPKSAVASYIERGNAIINSQCGQQKGSLAISAIEDDSITKIDYTDTIPVRFVNPESNKAMGLESGGTCTNGEKLKLQTAIAGDGQTFYLKRMEDGSGNWEIRNKACSDKVVDISGTGCEAGTEIQLNDSSPDGRNEWKIKDGRLESAKCEGWVMQIQSTSILDGSSIVLGPNRGGVSWSQAWSIKSNAARLLTEKGDPGQDWMASFTRLEQYG